VHCNSRNSQMIAAEFTKLRIVERRTIRRAVQKQHQRPTAGPNEEQPHAVALRVALFEIA